MGNIQNDKQDEVKASAKEGKKKPVGYEFETEGYAPDDLDSRWSRWKCGVCNYVYESSKSLKECPRCGNDDPDKFIDID